MFIEELLGVIFSFWTALAILIIIVVKSSIKFVPQNRAYVVERFGKYNKTMVAGLNILSPFIDKVALVSVGKLKLIKMRVLTPLKQGKV